MKNFWRTAFRAAVSTTLIGGVLSGAAIAALPAAPATALTPPSCTTTWTATAAGTYSWNTAGDWNHGLPGTGSVACITEAGTYTVQLIGGATTIDALELGSGTSGDQETLDLWGTCSNNATLDTTNTADSPDFDTIASTGQLFIGSTSCGNSSTLGIGTSLDESSGGLIETDADAGGSRAISGNITNDGTVNIDVNTTYSSGTWDNAGPLNIANSEALTFATSTPASTFTDDTGGSVTTPSSGELVIDSGNTYNQGNGTTSTEPVLLAGAQSGPTIAVHYTGNGASDLVAEGQETFDGTIASAQTLEIAGTCSDNALDTEDASLTNNGTIDVTSTGCGNNSQLTVSSGDTLTNDGTLETVAGAGAAKTIVGNVDNNGTADIDINTTYEMGAWDNKGALDISNSETLTVATATPASTFTDDTGGSVTSPSSGTGQLVIDSGNTYNQGNGITSSEPVLLASAQSGPTIAVHYTGNGASDLLAEGQETFDGTIASGQTLEIAGYCSDNASDTEDASLTNNGTIEVSSTGCGNNSQLTVASGDTLTNDGTLETLPGVGAAKTIVGNVDNNGTTDIDTNTTYESGTWDNKGALDISTSEALTVATATPAATFTNDTGGSITSVSSGTGELIVDDGNTVNQDNGSTSGEPVVIAASQSGPAVTLNYGGDTSAGASTIWPKERRL